MCRVTTLCVAVPIWGVCRDSYTLQVCRATAVQSCQSHNFAADTRNVRRGLAWNIVIRPRSIRRVPAHKLALASRPDRALFFDIRVETTEYQVKRRTGRIATGRTYLHFEDNETRMRGTRSGQWQGVASDHLEGNQAAAYDDTGGLTDMARSLQLTRSGRRLGGLFAV